MDISRLSPADQAWIRAEIARVERHYSRIQFWSWCAMMVVAFGVWWWRG